MTKRQKILKEKHGTPSQFVIAVWKAYAQLVITCKEAQNAIKKYENEWQMAGIK